MYPDEYEYDFPLMESIEKTLKSYFMGQVTIRWHKRNEPVNYIEKTDLTVVIVTDIEKKTRLQAKVSEKYPNSFSVGKSAAKSYIEDHLMLDGLLIGLKTANVIYLVDWLEFVSFLEHNLNTDCCPLISNKFYIIQVSDLLDTVSYYEEIFCNF